MLLTRQVSSSQPSHCGRGSMSSIRAAARAALERKQREAAARAKSNADPLGTPASISRAESEGHQARATGGASSVKRAKTETQHLGVKSSRWGSSDDESDDDGAAREPTRPSEARTAVETAVAATTGQGYMEKMLAEANAFAASQRDIVDQEGSNGRHAKPSSGPRLFLDPSPIGSDLNDEDASRGHGTTPRGVRDTSNIDSIADELAELESDDEIPRRSTVDSKSRLIASASPRTEGDSLDEVRAGPQRPVKLDACHTEAVDAQIATDDGKEITMGEPTCTPMISLRRRPLNMLHGCRSVDAFERLNKIDEGTYGVVFKARDKETGEIAALKRVKMDEATDGFPLTALREVNILLSLDHPSIVNVNEVVVGSNMHFVFMVMEYAESDLKGIMDRMASTSTPKLTIPEVKSLMQQLFSGISYLHQNWIMHRDLKMTNILVTNNGDLKICDFGLARQFADPQGKYTQLVVTLWYRAPELLLGAKNYGPAIDVWSLGCIFGELLGASPMFNGRTEIDQLQKIFKLLGTPSDKIWPEFSSLPNVKNVTFAEQPYNKLRQKFQRDSTGLSEKGFELLNRLLTYDPSKRFSCMEALSHPFFQEYPDPKRPHFNC